MPRKPPETKPRSRKPALKAVPKATVSPITQALVQRKEPFVEIAYGGSVMVRPKKDIDAYLNGKGDLPEDFKRALVGLYVTYVYSGDPCGWQDE